MPLKSRGYQATNKKICFSDANRPDMLDQLPQSKRFMAILRCNETEHKLSDSLVFVKCNEMHWFAKTTFEATWGALMVCVCMRESVCVYV